MKKLIQGLVDFRRHTLPAYRLTFAKLAKSQNPDCLFIACSDSRVDPAQIFDVNPGQVFVVRNVAALVPPFETTPGHHGSNSNVSPGEIAIGVVIGRASEYFDFFVYAIGEFGLERDRGFYPLLQAVHWWGLQRLLWYYL